MRHTPKPSIVPFRWALFVFLAGMVLVYVIANLFVVSSVKKGLEGYQAQGQSVSAALIRDQLAREIARGSDPVEAFNNLDMGSSIQQAGALTSFALVAPDGAVAAKTEGDFFMATGNLERHKLKDLRTGEQITVPEYMATSSTFPGYLIGTAGSETSLLLGSAKLHSNGWYVFAQQDIAGIMMQVNMVRLALLAAFLVIAVMLLLLLVFFYTSMSAGFSAAVNSAAALEEASRLFQENTGALKAPLLTIQGLADMMAMAADQDERENYVKEIKLELRGVIGAIDRSINRI